MKKVFLLLLIAAVVLSVASAKGFVGGAASYEFGTITNEISGTDQDLDIENFYGALRGGHFFGKSAHHGIVYSLGIGGCTKYKEGAIDSSDDIDAVVSASVGYGFRMNLGEKMEAIIGVGGAGVSFGNEDESVTYGGGFVSLTGDYKLSRKFALIFGAEVKFLGTCEFSDNSLTDPDETTGCLVSPFFGCSFCY